MVLPDASAPKTSTTLPFGNPPIPKAKSSEREPVGVASTPSLSTISPKRIIEPFPN